MQQAGSLCSPAPLLAQIVEFPVAADEIIHVGQRMSYGLC